VPGSYTLSASSGGRPDRTSVEVKKGENVSNFARPAQTQ
jgi:hypothetical protein